jgi:hypothetical protein
MQYDKRSAIRQHLSWDCALMTLSGALVTPCALRDISITGARIAVSDPAGIPDEFVLLLTKNGRVRRSCSLVWRGETNIGVRFSSNAS